MPKTDTGANRRILVVEDHPVERAYLQNMPLTLGYRRVAEVGSSTEALSRWHHPTLGAIPAIDFVSAAHRLAGAPSCGVGATIARNLQGAA